MLQTCENPLNIPKKGSVCCMFLIYTWPPLCHVNIQGYFICRYTDKKRSKHIQGCLFSNQCVCCSFTKLFCSPICVSSAELADSPWNYCIIAHKHPQKETFKISPVRNFWCYSVCLLLYTSKKVTIYGENILVLIFYMPLSKQPKYPRLPVFTNGDFIYLGGLTNLWLYIIN